MKRHTKLILVGFVGTLVSPTATIAHPTISATTSPNVDPQTVAQLAARLRNAIAGSPRDAAQVDIEASLIFAIDQSGQPLDVVLAALGQIDTSKLTPAARSALAAVTATRVRVAQRGTGSIAGGSQIGPAFGVALTINGGSNTGNSDYAR